MAYDFDGITDRSPPRVVTVTTPPRGDDLEVIVTLLELADIELTPSRGSKYTFDQLLEMAREIGGPELTLAEGDVRIVVPFMKKLLPGLTRP